MHSLGNAIDPRASALLDAERERMERVQRAQIALSTLSLVQHMTIPDAVESACFDAITKALSA